MNLYIESFDSEYVDCYIATGTNVYGDGPERTVARVIFTGTPEQRQAAFKALQTALEGPDLFQAMGLEPVLWIDAICPRRMTAYPTRETSLKRTDDTPIPLYAAIAGITETEAKEAWQRQYVTPLSPAAPTFAEERSLSLNSWLAAYRSLGAIKEPQCKP